MKIIAKRHLSRKMLVLSLSVSISMAFLGFALLHGGNIAAVHADFADTRHNPSIGAQQVPSPEPTADTCVGTVSGNGTISGNWIRDCASEGRAGSYASYNTFTLTESADVTITAESAVDTYLFLREGSGRDGAVLYEDDDHADEIDCTAEFDSATDSCLVESLDAGTYTIEATTFTAGETGDFTLTISGLPDTIEPQPAVTIALGDLSWPSVMIQTRIAQYIAELGYGYSTSVESGSSQSLFQALRAGDIDVLMEFWLPIQEEIWEEALAEGTVSSPGSSLGSDWQSAFVIPKYLQEDYPDLDSIEDLKDEQYRSLFATDETGDKARLVSCVIGWQCEEVNAKQIEGHGLSDHVQIVNPESLDALNADLVEAYENGEAWLGYQWGTNETALLLDLVRLEEPEYSDACWTTTMACAYEYSTVQIAINVGLSDSAADFVDVLSEWDFNVEEVYKPVVRWQADNPDTNTEDAAIWWLWENNDLWNEWVTADASAAIQDALDSGEVPAGWPEMPSITPEPTRTPRPEPTPSPTPVPPTDSCVGTISGDGAVSGNWSSDCASQGRSGSYASYYTFTLTESADVTIAAESGVDTYLLLRQGSGRDGSVVDENDDHDNPEFTLSSTTDSGISESLDAGTYTIEVTTYTAGETGEFTLTISGLPAAVAPQPTPTPEPTPSPTPVPPADSCVGTVSGDGTISGSWSSDCASEGRSGSYASYYTFTLTETADVTITAESGVDTYLFLREGSGRDGSVVDENDDHDDSEFSLGSTTDSGISESLDAGSYTIEVTTYTAGESGEFTLTISGLPAAITPTPEPSPTPGPSPEPTPTPEPPADECVGTVSGNGAISGSWDSDCASEGRSGSYASYHTFTLAASADVTITAESSVDTYLFLREGAGRDGTVVDGNDDHADESDCTAEFERTTDSCIVHSLDAGTYTIEVTTYTDGETGEFTLIISGLPAAAAPGPSSDRAALVALYNATDGDNWTTKHNWLSDEPLGEWQGVTTDDDGRVTQIRLGDNNLVGSIPSDLGDLSSLEILALQDNQLSGEIPVESGNLSNLTELWAWSNQLSGEIPSELSSLPNLQHLSLSDNRLSGEIPAALGNLSTLRSLYLNANQLSGEIPSELGNLSNLTLLDLPDNQLSGEIPAELGRLASLIELYLWGNELSGDIPSELGSLSSLTVLDLGGNQLSGEIPAELGSLTNLERLYLANNQLSGGIPSELGDISSLVVLDLNDNQLSGVIPSELGNLTSLTEFFAWENELSGEIPEELGSLSNLTELQLCCNEFSGEIPAELGNLASLVVIGLDENQLSGEIPEELGNLSNLTLLDLPENQFSGEIPSELGNLSNLTVLGLWGNELSGEIPSELGSLANLTRLYLNNNDLSGEIPSELGDLDNLQRLDLGDNELSGEIPSELGSLSNLERISLNENELSGEIPSELGSLSSLERMSLNYNELSGEIPSELGSLSNLERIYLHGNQLSGEIPAELGGLSDLTELHLWGNQLSGEIPSELGDLMNLTTLELAQNQLSGEIPSELGNLSNLTLLNLTRNEVSGEIPDELGRLNSLEILALGGNQLSGEIPAELGNLSSLTRLHLWTNQLTGGIPAELGNLSNLDILELAVNELSGEIPNELGRLADLEYLNLGRNQLSGEIPSELGRLDNLDQLYLYNNQLSGDVPSELLAKSGLRIMALYGNQLSGDVPEHTEERAILTTLYNSTGGTDWNENENWGSAEPVFTWSRVLIDTSGHVTALWLHENQLSGEIPSELGSLTNLARLFLFDNQLTGEIPSELSNLEDLEHLFLAGNQLSGCIPVGLQDLPGNDFGDLDLEFCSDEN